MSSTPATLMHRDCPLCGRDNATVPADPVYSRDDWLVKHCAGCGFVYLENPPYYEALASDFAWEKTSKLERERRRADEPVLDWLSQGARWFRRRVLKRNKLVTLTDRFVSKGRLLDVGCGKGTQLINLLDDRFQPYGIEISTALAAHADAVFEPLGGHCACNNAIDGLREFGPDLFDGILMKSYLEHEVSPRPVCEGALRALKPGGVLIVKVPNFASWNRYVRRERWCGLRYPDHVNYFTPRQLLGLMREVGFEIVRFNFFDKVPTSDNMWLVARKPRASAGRIADAPNAG